VYQKYERNTTNREMCGRIEWKVTRHQISSGILKPTKFVAQSFVSYTMDSPGVLLDGGFVVEGMN
jgi:hypothetical protein